MMRMRCSSHTGLTYHKIILMRRTSQCCSPPRSPPGHTRHPPQAAVGERHQTHRRPPVHRTRTDCRRGPS